MKYMLNLRSMSSDDLEFSYRVYASTRDDIQAMDCDAAKKEMFLRQQSHFQHTFYMEQDQYTGAEFNIILLENEPIGRLYINRLQKEIRLVDIALLPEYRNKGVGLYFLERILDEGRKSRRPVTIYVERYNPALRLYEQLDFRKESENGVYFFMQWTPKGNSKEST